MLPLFLAVGLVALPQTPDTATYLDATARVLVERARAARRDQAAGILAYSATAKERIYFGMRALRRDRVFYHSETAARVRWHRIGHDSVEVLGAREGIPIALPHDEVPDDIRHDAPDLLWNPSSDRMSFGDGDNFVHHPLGDSAAADYRYQSGDTTSIILPNGVEIQLYELKIIPRRPDPHLMAGSIWIEAKGYSMVRALFQLARPWDLELDLDRESGENVSSHIPGFLTPIRAELKYATVEFSLWKNHWWVPRLQSIDGTGTAGSIASFPLRFEIAYSDYQLDGDTTEHTPPPVARLDSAVADSLWKRCSSDSTGSIACHCHDHQCHEVTVVLPADTLALLTSPDLPPSFVTDESALTTRSDLDDILADLHLLPGSGFAEPARVRALWQAPGLLRYNRVEALSLGARADLPVGPLAVDGTLRIATATGQPDLDVGLTRKTQDLSARFGAYRRLTSVDPDAHSLGFGNSIQALALGRDDGDYFRAAGVDVDVKPALTESQSYEWRLYAEHQFAAPFGSDASLGHLLDRDRIFRPEIHADRADQIGTTLRLRGDLPLNQGRAALGGNVDMDLSVGTFTFARLAVTGRATAPLPGPFQGAVEVSGGASDGPVPVQSHWYLGGPTTLRGYGGDAADGTAFWRARAELGLGIPGARLALFSDAGWAGSGRSAFTAHPLISAGVGASFLDGLFRLDLARALTFTRGWRLELYTDAAL
ncbi:MAG TPA: BamA/TamA family outer membrane protein [Gemmatimonadales bacterium]|nr:BamA/TamA family outer membrane protein [Gemmatimonadales bacterium]